MPFTRRQLLRATGVGVGGALLVHSASVGGVADGGDDDDEDRVFIHPADDRVTDVIDALELLDGTLLHRYDNFDVVAARIPSSVRDELAADSRVAELEDDPVIELTASGPSAERTDLGDGLIDVGFGDSDDDGDGVIDIGDDGLIGIGDDDDDGTDLSCLDHIGQRPAWGWDRIGADVPEETGDGVDVAILDTGIDTDHCDLEVAGGRSFTGLGSGSDYDDRHGHGTHCAGIVGALDNDIGVVGVAPEVNLYGVQVLEDDGRGHHSTMAAGIDWCLSNDVEIISMSFGSQRRSTTMDTVIDSAVEEGHLLVASAGNEGNSGPDSCDEETLTYPVTHEGVIAVAAMDEDDSLASYSSVGDEVDLLAPGSNVYSTDAGNGYAHKSGTSMAAPYVSGAAALVWERREETGPGPNAAVRDTLETTAEPVLDACAEGHGLVNAAAATGADGSGGGSDDDGSDGDGSTGDGGGSDGSDGSDASDGPGGGQGLVDAVDPTSLWDRLTDAIDRLFSWLRNLF